MFTLILTILLLTASFGITMCAIYTYIISLHQPYLELPTEEYKNQHLPIQPKPSIVLDTLPIITVINVAYYHQEDFILNHFSCQSDYNLTRYNSRKIILNHEWAIMEIDNSSNHSDNEYDTLEADHLFIYNSTSIIEVRQYGHFKLYGWG